MQLNSLLCPAGVKIAVVFLVGFLTIGCKKEAGVDNSELQRKLKGRWMIGSYITNQYYSRADHINSISVSQGDYIDFEPEDKLYLRLFSATDTSKYTIVPNNRIVFDYSDTFDIRTLTEKELVLYNKREYSAESYYEQTFNLQR